MGTVINIHNEEWVRRGEGELCYRQEMENGTTQNIENSEIHVRPYIFHNSIHEPYYSNLVTCVFADSGVGAGIDSYYEYLMKAYILLGDNVFLERFNIVSLPSLYAYMEICIQAFGTCCIVLPVAT